MVLRYKLITSTSISIIFTFCVENVNCRLPLDSTLTESKFSKLILSPSVALKS